MLRAIGVAFCFPRIWATTLSDYIHLVLKNTRIIKYKFAHPEFGRRPAKPIPDKSALESSIDAAGMDSDALDYMAKRYEYGLS